MELEEGTVPFLVDGQYEVGLSRDKEMQCYMTVDPKMTVQEMLKSGLGRTCDGTVYRAIALTIHMKTRAEDEADGLAADDKKKDDDNQKDEDQKKDDDSSDDDSSDDDEKKDDKVSHKRKYQELSELGRSAES